MPELVNLGLEAPRAALRRCVKKAMKKMVELWKVFEVLESGPGGLQASFEQLLNRSNEENDRVLEGA